MGLYQAQISTINSPMRIAVIGGGPAGLMAADTLAPHAQVDLYEHGRQPGRKFLVAGQGGFNLTNSAEGEDLLLRYTPPGFLDEALKAFGPLELRAWLAELGVATYVGSSGRVFPLRGTKPAEVLLRIRERLEQRGVIIHVQHAFTGFGPHGEVRMENDQSSFTLAADHVVFALGGGSWPVTGSTGIWPPLFAAIGIEVHPFRSSNCGVEIRWPAAFIQAHEGKPLKNIRISADGAEAWGEATITRHGLEGNAVYPVVPAFRAGGTELRIDLKPESNTDRLIERIGDKEAKNYCAAVGLNRAQVALFKAYTPKDAFSSPARFAGYVKDLCLPVQGLRPLGEAISTVGGIATRALQPDFTLQGQPHLSAIGEMVDWDAPTGGFLLQGCFAMGRHAALGILSRNKGAEMVR